MPLGYQFSGRMALGGVLARGLTAEGCCRGRFEVWSHSSGVESLPSLRLTLGFNPVPQHSL